MKAALPTGLRALDAVLVLLCGLIAPDSVSAVCWDRPMDNARTVAHRGTPGELLGFPWRPLCTTYCRLAHKASAQLCTQDRTAAVDNRRTENPRPPYAAGHVVPGSAQLVRGSSRRIMTMRFRPANISVIIVDAGQLRRSIVRASHHAGIVGVSM